MIILLSTFSSTDTRMAERNKRFGPTDESLTKKFIQLFLSRFTSEKNNLYPLLFYRENTTVSLSTHLTEQRNSSLMRIQSAHFLTESWAPATYIDVVCDCLIADRTVDNDLKLVSFSCSGFIELNGLTTEEPLFFSRTFVLAKDDMNGSFFIFNDLFAIFQIQKFDISPNGSQLENSWESNSQSEESDGEVMKAPRESLANPIGVLNEWCQKQRKTLKFDTHSCGSKGATSFFQSVAIVDGSEPFPVGEGQSKQMAKKSAAANALEILLAVEHETPSAAEANPDHELLTRVGSNSDHQGVGFGNDSFDAEIIVSGATLQFINESGGKNPISLLLEHCQREKVKVDFHDDVAAGKFIFAVSISNGDGREDFPSGSGRSKKDAKSNAALLALDALVTSERFLTTSPKTLIKRTLPTLEFELDSLHGHVASWIHKVIGDVCASYPEAINSTKVIAGLVMWDCESKKGFVVSVGTGNRCVKGDLLSTSGQILNDCHAEIITMRGFKRVLYSQILEFVKIRAEPGKANSTMLELSPSGKLAIRPRFSFHLYINTAPCGDGRVFTLSEPEDSLGDPEYPHKHWPVMKDPKKHGILRTKIEKGEGTIPIVDQDIQTLDGINGGERLRTMSCSDKILKWNVLGIQGALLSAFLDPVYLGSVTIGTLSHHGHLSRAICCRAQKMDIPEGFKLNHPLLGTVGASAGRDTSKSTALSLNWNYADQAVELVDGTTGKPKTPYGTYSRLSKKTYLDLFRQVAEESENNSLVDPQLTYLMTKHNYCQSYWQAQLRFKRYCLEQKLGNWLGKPIEEKMFC